MGGERSNTYYGYVARSDVNYSGIPAV